jgi:2-(1,2-epoxy-1,2-dihydrophenyl)acetyl-CoA isomerase
MNAETTESPVLTRKADGFTVITLNRPTKLNAFTAELHVALREAFNQAAGDPDCRAIILTGAGRGFCAGQDLGERSFQNGAPDLGASLAENYNPLVMAIRKAEKPVIAAVNGVAAGAGANVALACDIVIAARSAKFIQAFSKIGLIPDAGGTWILPKLIGDARARALSILAEPVSAEQAVEWGMIWKVVDDAELASVTENLARDLASRPTRSFALMKKAFLAAPEQSLEAQLDMEAALQREAGRTEDFRIGVEAFRAGAKPQFKGR